MLRTEPEPAAVLVLFTLDDRASMVCLYLFSLCKVGTTLTSWCAKRIDAVVVIQPMSMQICYNPNANFPTKEA